MIGIGDAYPCSASAKNTTVFTRSAAAAAAAAADASDAAVSTPSGKEHGGDGVNLPLSRLSRYSAACNKAAMLIFDGGRRLVGIYAHTHRHTQRNTSVYTRTRTRNYINRLTGVNKKKTKKNYIFFYRNTVKSFRFR